MSERIKRLIKLISFDFENPHWAICDISNPPASGYDEAVLLKARKGRIEDLSQTELEILKALGEEYTPIEKNKDQGLQDKVVCESPDNQALIPDHTLLKQEDEKGEDVGVNVEKEETSEPATKSTFEEPEKEGNQTTMNLELKIAELEAIVEKQSQLLKQAEEKEVELQKQQISKELAKYSLAEDITTALSAHLQSQGEDVKALIIKSLDQVSAAKASEIVTEEEALEKSAVSSALQADLVLEKGTSSPVTEAAKDPVQDKWEKQAKAMENLLKSQSKI